jgi:acyl-CoA synthetase (NDP forming)
MLTPTSVAIVGASGTATRIGGRPLFYMLRGGFTGRILPVNPRSATVQGVPAYATIADLPEAPDVAIVALGAPLVRDAVRDLIAIGTKTAIIFSSGFAETGDEGAAWQADFTAIARQAGMRILGPNTLGVLNTRTNFCGTFSSAVEKGWPLTGGVGIASQSGAYGAHLLSLAMNRGMGISTFVTTGNEADITATDAIAWMAEDPGTNVIVSYLEGIKDGPRLIAALEAARQARKPVIMMKAGRSMIGSAAAQSHTASLAGDDAIVDAVFREFGVLRVDSAQQALDFAETATRRIYPVPNSIGVITLSGGAGILIADDAERLGQPMPPLPDDIQAAMKARLSFAATRNPVDCTAQALNDISLIGDFGTMMVDSGQYKSLLLFFSHAGGQASVVTGLRQQLRRIIERAPDCLCVLTVIADPDVVRAYQEDGAVVFDDPARAVAAIAAMGRLGEAFALPAATKHEARTLPLRTQADGALNEQQAKQIFAVAGIVVPREILVSREQDVASAVADIGLPLVMKIVSPDIVHKTEVGGVIVGVGSPEAATAGFVELNRRARSARPDARLDGVLLAQQIDGGVECFMGVKRDPVFGPIAVFGLGGIFVEVLRDVALRRCPFGVATAADMIRSIQGFAVLDGARGRDPVDLASLAIMLSRLSHLAMDFGPEMLAIDINPVIATPSGAWAADGVIEFDHSVKDAFEEGQAQ